MRDDLLFKIGQSVRYIRLKKNISQEELAFRASLNMNSISTLERGLNNVKIKTLYKIAEALEVDVNEILNCKF
ncbi:helix-turn-helix transcriptional regulator [bacterium]|nr:helix-turn-helix transcriptional regulator [bacterium]